MISSILLTSIIIRMQDPLKQGLKLGYIQPVLSSQRIRMQDPLKQGLKPDPSGWGMSSLSRFECKIH